MANDIKLLTRIRGSIKQKLTNLEKYINVIRDSEPNNVPPLSEVEIRLNNNHSLLKDFEENQLKIEMLCDENSLPDHYAERDNFELRYSSAMSFLSDHVKNNSELGKPIDQLNFPSSNSMSQINLQNAIVPKIKLPNFKGDSEHWLEFKTTFTAVIHKNTSLGSIQKFQLLKASLEGYAKRLIDNVEFIESNYENAWNLLCKRFDSKRILINNHFKSICRLDQLQKESSTQLRKLLDDVSNHLSALEGLHLPKDVLYEILITHVISNKLDRTTYRDWKNFKGKNELPSLDEFLEFLKNKADLLEEINDQGFSQNQHSKNNVKQFKNYSQTNSSSSVNIKCNFCKGAHLIYTCSDFLKLSVKERIDNVKKLKLCANCLKTRHNEEACRSGTCRKCQAKHNSLLHQDELPLTSNTTTQVTLCSNTPPLTTQVLLSTVMVNVKDSKGSLHPCRLLLDSGAQSNFISQHFYEKLNIPSQATNISIIGINQITSNLKRQCNITISSCCNNFTTTILCYIIPNISGELPNERIDTSKWNIPQNIPLADPEFHEPKEVDMLIGASIFWDLLVEGKVNLGKGKPTLQNSKFGWIISGTIPRNTSLIYCNFSQSISNEDDQLKKFWELEEIPNTILYMSEDDLQCESIFKNTTSRNDKGQFVVRIPLKHPLSLLGDSKVTAVKRFHSLERKLSSNKDLEKQYHQFINEYESLGHMSRLDTSEISKNNSISYFLPHHGVQKESSLSTKLRVVFDGSCATTSGYSINDLQFTGPKIQNNIFSILLRFRKHTFVVSADVSKMYRQVLIHPDDRPLQGIIWRKNPDDDISIFQLNTVTYGTSSAPYLAMRCLQQLALENKENHPISSQIILDDFYVDDLLTGSDDLHQLNTICLEISSILHSACFPLRKWIANDSNILQGVGDSSDPISILKLGDNESSKTLGIQWNSVSDSLQYKISEYQATEPISKRKILSDIAQIYDPLGLLSPCVILSKIIIQHLWSLKLNWDDDVPSEWSDKWFQFRISLNQLNQLQIPRHVVCKNVQMIEFHCFCDASQEAYACCIYIRSKNESGVIHVQLLCAKSKVAPLKCVSIPRLELCAALLGAQLMKQVTESFKTLPVCYFWTDSQVTLHWIHTQPNLLKTFVANRVSKIQNLSEPHNWNYVNTKDNPADLASRGVLPDKLIPSTLWWNGPHFLMSDKISWSSSVDIKTDKFVVPELKQKVQIFKATTNESLNLFDKFSSINKLKRTISYCFRFSKNCRLKPTERQTGPLTIVELDYTWLRLLKLCQQESFANEISIIENKSTLTSKHNLSSLSPFINKDGLLCVGGRLKFSSLHSNIKHPILLSSKHILTQLLFRQEHLRMLHAGPQLLLATIRQNYWPIGGKNLARQTVKTCITCFKFKPEAAQVPMGNLPDSRISQSLPFEHTGIDFAGPFSLKDRKGRGAKFSKCYLCVFICFCTKAIHLELTTSLDTEHFFSCLKRFMSRRGLPRHIYSDNGRTFLSAHNELRDLGNFIYHSQDDIINHASQSNISWHFIPPYSPNFGGLWEAAVKGTKHHLKRILSTATFTYEEFATLITQIEGILNSRPLFALSADPNDLTPITPSHFLTGRVITSIPEHDLQDISPARLSRFQFIQQLIQQFWKRWSTEYVTQLHQQYKWKTNSLVLNHGTLVLIGNSKLPPYKWQLGRIHELHPGLDGISRVATVYTPRGLIKRSTRHLYPLPLQDDLCSEVQVNQCTHFQCEMNKPQLTPHT